MRRMMEYLGLVDPVDDGAYRYGPDDDAGAPAPREAPRQMRPVGPEDGVAAIRTMPADTPSEQSGVTPISGPVRTLRPGSRERRMHVVAPREFQDAQEIGDRLKAGSPVVIDVTETDERTSRRLIDFASGVVFMADGRMQRISRGVFLLTPQNVELSESDKRRLAERGLYQVEG